MFGSSSVPSTSVVDLSDELFLLDVREDDEWEAGHAPSAVHAAMSLNAGILDLLPAVGMIAVICKVGGRSAKVTAFLIDQGREAINVEGGMMNWAAAGRPVVNNQGDEGFVL
ncbi:MAG: rhodanese-like domain-containing protein [Actinobacteria bacterium]|nr:rhodanese-like domain-containing protein [Actinomycetota bacterium]